jgi:hypothetical protein
MVSWGNTSLLDFNNKDNWTQVDKNYDVKDGDLYGYFNIFQPEKSDDEVLNKIKENIETYGDEPLAIEVKTLTDYVPGIGVIKYQYVKYVARHKAKSTPIVVIIGIIIAFLIALAIAGYEFYYIFTGKTIPLPTAELGGLGIIIIIILILILLIFGRKK